MNSKKCVMLFSGFCLLSILFFQNCGGLMGAVGEDQGTSFGNSSLHISFEAYSRVPVASPLQRANTLTSKNLDGVSVIFCMAELKFKMIQDYEETGDADTDNIIINRIDYLAQEVSISPLGTELGFIGVPSEAYRQIEFLLDGAMCDSGASVQVVNSFGTFSSSASIKLKFNGNKYIYFSTDEVQMSIVPIIEAISLVSSNAELKSKIESVNGQIRN